MKTKVTPAVAPFAEQDKPHFWRSLGLLLFALALGSGCAGRRSGEVSSLRSAETPKSSKIEPEARTLFFQAERAFNAKNYDQARTLYQTVKVRYPRGRAQMLSSYRLGTIYYYKEDYATAVREFEFFLTHFPQSELAFDVIYNDAAAEFQLGRYEKAYLLLSRLKATEIQAQGPRRAEVVYQLEAQTALALSNSVGAVTAWAAEMQLPLEERSRSSLEENIDSQLARITTRADLERLLAEVSEPTTRGKITARMGTMNSATVAMVETSPLPAGKPEDLSSPMSGLPLAATSTGEKFNIGVILPLTGKFSAYGNRALEGILLAAKSYAPTREGDFRLFIEDSASSPAMAQQAVETLVAEHDVMAIIGPLNWKESVATAERAQQLGVMNLSLSAKEGIADKGAYLFQNAITPRIQFDNLAQFCILERQLKRFAILAPNDNFGKDIAGQFWDAVEKYGGKVVAYQSYPADEKDFQAEVQELVGVQNPKFRKLEFGKMWEFINDQKTKTGKEPKSRLPPIVDFDALFVPDSPKTVAQVAASLAYYDVSGVALLGTTDWNGDQLYKRGGRYVEGAFFPGGVNLATKNPRQKEFIRFYADAFGGPPDLLAGQAYEAMEVIGTSLKKMSSGDRNELVNQVLALREFETPLGRLSFDNSRIAKRKIAIFGLEYGGSIVEH
jgi:ABC-type branched-subunit amino acid transport system substrate-binding protein